MKAKRMILNAIDRLYKSVDQDFWLNDDDVIFTDEQLRNEIEINLRDDIKILIKEYLKDFTIVSTNRL